MANPLTSHASSVSVPPMGEAIRLLASRAASLEARGELLELVESWQHLGQACLLARDLEAAFRWFTHALELAELMSTPNLPELYRSLGLTSRAQGDEAGCRFWFSRAEASESPVSAEKRVSGGLQGDMASTIN